MAVKWHEQARKMRGDGAKLSDIGAAFGVTAERVRQVCVGISCPVNHLGLHFSDREWRKMHPRTPRRRLERETYIRSHYKNDMTAEEIGAALGISRNAVIGSARDLGLCASIPKPN